MGEWNRGLTSWPAARLHLWLQQPMESGAGPGFQLGFCFTSCTCAGPRVDHPRLLELVRVDFSAQACRPGVLWAPGVPLWGRGDSCFTCVRGPSHAPAAEASPSPCSARRPALSTDSSPGSRELKIDAGAQAEQRKWGSSVSSLARPKLMRCSHNAAIHT